MPKIFVVEKKQLIGFTAFGLLVLSAIFIFSAKDKAVPANVAPGQQARVIHMVTGEFKSETEDGKTIEAYRWDPGTVIVHEGELVKLSIFGVNGDSHPFVIEGLNVKGEVKKGKVTEVTFTASKKGIYRLICLAHPDIAHGGPMIGYIVVI